MLRLALSKSIFRLASASRPRQISTTAHLLERKKRNERPILAKTSSLLPSKIQIPPVYPQLLAIPMSNRPLFPGFYKPIVVTDLNVIKAIQALVDKGQAYVGIFLSKSDNDSDIVSSIQDVHDTGVFASITAVSMSADKKSMSVVLLVHRRIKLTGKADVVSPINSHLLGFNVSLFNVVNLPDEEIRNSDYVKAITTELVVVLKELAMTNPLVRDQVYEFSNLVENNVTNEPSKFGIFI